MKSKNNFFIFSQLTPIFGKRGVFFNTNHYNGKINIHGISIDELFQNRNGIISFSLTSLTSIFFNNQLLINSKGQFLLVGTYYPYHNVIVLFDKNNNFGFYTSSSKNLSNYVDQNGSGDMFDMAQYDYELQHQLNLNPSGDTFYEQLHNMMNGNRYIYIE